MSKKKQKKKQDIKQKAEQDYSLKEYVCPVCGDFSSDNFTSVDRHSRAKHGTGLGLDAENNIVICSKEEGGRLKSQKSKKITEKYQDPYILSNEEETARLRSENKVLAERLRQADMRARGVDLPQYQSPRDYRENKVMSDLAIAEYFDRKTKTLDKEDHPKSSSNPEFELLQGELSDMKKSYNDLMHKFDEEKEKRHEEEMKSIKDKLSSIERGQNTTNNVFGAIDSGIKEVGSLAKEYLELGKIALGMRKTAPKRETVGDDGSFPYDMLPDDMVVNE